MCQKITYLRCLYLEDRKKITKKYLSTVNRVSNWHKTRSICQIWQLTDGYSISACGTLQIFENIIFKKTLTELSINNNTASYRREFSGKTFLFLCKTLNSAFTIERDILGGNLLRSLRKHSVQMTFGIGDTLVRKYKEGISGPFRRISCDSLYSKW